MQLSAKAICKSFGAGNVLDAVDFDVRGGEICALLGENGAGKSTLVNIIGGVLNADSGELMIDGKKVMFSSPAESLASGIAFIHQELNLINDLTVYENIFLNCFPKKGVFIDNDRMISETEELFTRLGIEISPKTPVVELDASYKQMVEIARALHSEASVIIMDEPTASLSSSEAERVFGIMRALKKNGIAMIFISHKLDEVMSICDRYTVLRNGKTVSSGNIADTTAAELASYMVGHSVKGAERYVPSEYGEEVFRIEGLTDGSNFEDISLSVQRGEILGVTGLLGDRRSEIFETAFGIHGGKYTGRIVLDGTEIHPSMPHEAVRRGLAYLPKNRKENAIIADMSIVDNGTAATLRRYSLYGLFDVAAQKRDFAGQVTGLNIKMSSEKNSINSLSGGNQQKTIISKWLLSEPKVLIVDNPTQGVDVGAKQEVYTILKALADSGMAIIVLSAEMQEIIRICDRSLVLYHGRIAGELCGDEMNENNMMLLATGAAKRA